MITRYSRNYFPPAPAAQVVIAVPIENTRTEPISAFIDTGADATLVPLNYLLNVDAPRTEEMMISSQWGEGRRVWLYLVNIQIGEILISDIEVVGDEMSDEIILGRDVLNQLRLLLDGPDERVEILE